MEVTKIVVNRLRPQGGLGVKKSYEVMLKDHIEMNKMLKTA